MGGDSSFLAMLRIAGFLSAAWMATKVSRMIGVSSIVLEITTGVVLGPELLGLLPTQYSVAEGETWIDCTRPDGFDNNSGRPLTEELAEIEHHGYCPYDKYMEKLHAGQHESSLQVNFTAAGVMYRYLEADQVLETEFVDMVTSTLSTSYMPPSRPEESSHGAGSHHRRLEHHVGSHTEDGGMDASFEEGVFVHLYESHSGAVMVQVDFNVVDDGSLKGRLEHDIKDDTFQSKLAAAIKGMDFIGMAADVNSIEIMDVSASMIADVMNPMPENVSSHTPRFIMAKGNNLSLYFQVGTTRHFVANDTDRYELDASYLRECYSEALVETVTDEDMLALPVGVKWWGCGMMITPAPTPAPEPHDTTTAAGYMTTDAVENGQRRLRLQEQAPQRRLSGGGSDKIKYDSYGECLIKECEAHKSSAKQLNPDVFSLIGHTGVAMMIFESGMHFDFGMARQVGPMACVIAVIGTFLPLITGMLVAWAFGNPINPDGLTAGTALAPTSVGISLRLLGEAGVLNLDFGQTIMTAAFVDDILSLILFNIIFAVAAGEITFMGTFFKSIMGIVFMLFAVFLAVYFWPWMLKNYLLPGCELIKRYLSPPDPDDPPKITEKDEALFAIMLAMLIGYALITYICGTHLWGCFIAGMSFACLDEEPGHAHHVWVKQTKRITSWMIRIFFCSTVAFSIPVNQLLSFEAFWKGSIMGIGPCILTKVSCAIFMGPPKFVIGWAMVGRAEFAYLIAQMGMAGGVIKPELYSQLIWALLWATIFAPLIFKKVLNNYIRDNAIEVVSPRKAAGGHDNGHSPGEGLVGAQEHRQLEPVVEDHHEQKPDSQEHKSYAAAEDHVTFKGNAAGKAWEEEALAVASNKTADEMPPMPTLQKVRNTPGQDGRGFLCCIFFKKVTTV